MMGKVFVCIIVWVNFQQVAKTFLINILFPATLNNLQRYCANTSLLYLR